MENESNPQLECSESGREGVGEGERDLMSKYTKVCIRQ